MIDASSFAASYNAFWNEAAPTLEHFVRRVNLERLDRFELPIVGSETTRRAVIAEYAFSIFFERWRDPNAKTNEVEVRNAAWEQTVYHLKLFQRQGLDLETKLRGDESAEADELAKRLQEFFVRKLSPSAVRPIFQGCGLIDASEADVFANSTLFEVKTVDRAFRSVDLRQVITYVALNHSSKQFFIEKVGLLNPRRGQYFSLPVEDISREISGRPAEELLSLITQTVSSGEVSR